MRHWESTLRRIGEAWWSSEGYSKIYHRTLTGETEYGSDRKRSYLIIKWTQRSLRIKIKYWRRSIIINKEMDRSRRKIENDHGINLWIN